MDEPCWNDIDELLGIFDEGPFDVVNEHDPEKVARFYELVNMWIDETQGLGYFDDWLAEKGLEE